MKKMCLLILLFTLSVQANQCRFYTNKLQQELYFYKKAQAWTNKEKSLKLIEKYIKEVKAKCKT